MPHLSRYSEGITASPIVSARSDTPLTDREGHPSEVGATMARALYVAPVNLESAAQIASLRARVKELETEVSALRSEVVSLRAAADPRLDAELLDVELRQVTSESADLAAALR